MARNDVFLNINALSPADAVVTGQQDMTAATVPELVLGDTPTFNFYFTDNTNVWPSWAGNASYTLTWALSDAVAGDFAPAATTGNATPITGGWSVILPLNSYDLVGLLNTKRVGQPYPVTNLWQQLRVTDPSGNEVTRAMFWTPVRYRAISDTQNTESASPTGGRFVTVNNVNTLTTPTAAQFYAANPVPTSALGTAANGELLIGNGTGFTKATLTAGSGVSITNGSGSITITATDGDITLDDGTAAAPSLKFTADTDTGIYRPSDNVVGISAGGVSRATFGATSAINGTTIPSSKTLVVTTDKLSALAATTSAELAGVISDETGSGALVFANTPTLVTPNIGAATGTSFNLTGSGTLGTTLTINGTTDSSSKDTGAIVTEGGLGVEKSATFGGNLTVSGAANVGNLLTVTGSGTETGVATAKVGASALGGIPRVNLINATNAVNGKYGDIINTAASGNGAFQFRFIDDAITAATAVLSITGRQGATDSFVTAPGTGAHTFGTTNTVTLTNGVLATTGAGTIGGNLTVSGTGTHSFAGQVTSFANSANAANFGSFVASNATLNSFTSYSSSASLDQKYWTWQAGTAVGDGTIRLRALNDAGTNGINALTVTRSGISSTAVEVGGNLTVSGTGNSSVAGTLLVATTTNSSNGKLQLATHTTSAGGIGFGTDTSLFRSSAGVLTLDTSGGFQGFEAKRNGTLQTALYSNSTNTFLSYLGSLAIQTTTGTTALTLDSSQNATFAGDVTVSGGNMGVGIGASASIALSVTPSTLTGNTQYGVAGYPVFSSAATAAGYSGYFEMKTAASAFTMAVGRSIFVEVPTIGAGSAITTQSGIYVSNQGTGSITNAYGIDIAAQSGATTTNIGLRNLGATVLATPAAAVTLATNSTMTFELTSNTSLTIKVRGTDGTTRSVALTLA